ncbi:hypothetical protein AR457_40375 [Streptomyces agglomeratus]|uniref:hypothetical protein n=1 Tax=Streptomyces agglomeratus TaxID=285458 RepID=UPI000852560F|nr:hypothetical protein [Streptomyces agglomeratus]OEJ22138.1 hypothetical protein AR457_40375 [Streptomyces agglomeratus]OEJ36976.1 hypothetical protein BGK70_01030 [Streptomyces agglomeratus]
MTDLATGPGLAAGTALLSAAGDGADRHLSDLLATAANGAPACYLADPGAARTARDAGNDPVLYTAHRDILPPTRALGADWFADLCVYRPGRLPGGELNRSIGHWNTPAQLEVFEVLSGRVLMITAWHDPSGTPVLNWQACGPGDLVAVPFGAWHQTSLLDGPATVFNIYTDLPGTEQHHTSRHAAQHAEIKYRSSAPVEITAIRAGTGFTLTGSRRGRNRWGRGVRAVEPAWLRKAVGPDGLVALHTSACADQLSGLVNAARAQLPQPQPRLEGDRT